MSALFSSRTLLFATTTAVAGAISLLGLPASGSPGLAAPAPVAETVAATLQQARPAPAVPAAAPVTPAAVGATAAATPAHPAPLDDLLRRQAAAGLDCEVTQRGVPVCIHGDDPEPVSGDHATHSNDAPAGGGGTAHGTAESTTGSSGSIGCYGDGTSGPRVRAIYARPQSAADRYDANAGAIRGWAAGVSNHFDSSAARTGGRRHVRFATTAGESCSVTVLNVTLPDAAFKSFTATIDALQARGLDAPNSKYLVWADATGYCGVATTYADDEPGLDNLNNGSFPTYARVDRRCWGKVETHEVVHMLGGVQRSAPNSTEGMHCNDGTDLMCYDDGTARSTQRSVCGSENAELLDCRNNDYFSTAAPKGSYLQTHWNTARSSFLSPVLSEPAPSEPKPTSSPTASPSPTSAPPPRGVLGLPLPTIPTVPTVPPLPTLPPLTPLTPLPTLTPLPLSVLSAGR